MALPRPSSNISYWGAIMTLNCLICMATAEGRGFAEVRVNSIDQLAAVMPSPVTAYEIHRQVVSTSGAQVQDAELVDLLMGAIRDITCQCASEPGSD